MAFKINIATKDGKTFHIESDAESLMGKELHDKVEGKDISSDLEGYEFEISGASDKSGFTAMKNVEGIGLKKVLLTYGKAMKTRPKKEGKKKQLCKKPKGLRLRKTVRGKVISEAIIQINLKIVKEGKKKLSEIFQEQNNKGEAVKEVKAEEKVEEKKESETPKEEKKE
jgi:small subunit ribosomal protein S6e